MFYICGDNCYFQLVEKSTNKSDHYKTPIISPLMQSPFDASSIISYSIYNHHSIIITRGGSPLGIGNNKDSQISGSLPQEFLDHLIIFPIKDSEGHSCIAISAVCGFTYTLYMVSVPEENNKRYLAYSYSYSKDKYPTFCNIGSRIPIALYGGRYNSAAIDTEGAIIFIGRALAKEYKATFLPDDEKAVKVACCDDFIYALSLNNRVFVSPAQNILSFTEVNELIGKNIIDISGTSCHCLAVDNEGHAYSQGKDYSGRLGLGISNMSISTFKQIESLNKFKIAAAYAGLYHSLFQTSEGQIFSCGNNTHGELMSGIPKDENICYPSYTSISSGASFCIAGSGVSIIFCGYVPSNSPNIRVNDFKIKEEASSSLQEELSDLQSKNSELLDEISSLKQKTSNSTTCKSSNENDSNVRRIEILDSEDIRNLRTVREIGFGSSGKVVEVAKEETYALKIMNTSDTSIEKQRSFLGEFEKLSMLQHPNIVKAYGIFLSDETLPFSILLELCPTDMQKAIKSNALTPVDIVKSVYQIVEGMRYVHFRNLIHRDIKPQNILFGKDGLIRISDFGISKLMTAEEQSTTLGVGTQKYMAPEILNEEKYNEKVDVYAFGVLLFFMLTGGDMPKITIIQVGTGKKAPIPSTLTEFSRSLIDKCWNFDPKLRPSFKEISNELTNNDFMLMPLSESDINEVKSFVKKHKAQIPSYAD